MPHSTLFQSNNSVLQDMVLAYQQKVHSFQAVYGSHWFQPTNRKFTVFRQFMVLFFPFPPGFASFFFFDDYVLEFLHYQIVSLFVFFWFYFNSNNADSLSITIRWISVGRELHVCVIANVKFSHSLLLVDETLQDVTHLCLDLMI